MPAQSGNVLLISELKIRRRRDSTTADVVEEAWGEVATSSPGLFPQKMGGAGKMPKQVYDIIIVNKHINKHKKRLVKLTGLLSLSS